MPQGRSPGQRVSGRGGDLLSKSGDRRPDLAPISAAPQPEIFVEHSQHAAISVALSRDRGRVTVTTFAKVGGTWRAVGVTPSFPAIVLDSVIDALQALRDRMGTGGAG